MLAYSTWKDYWSLCQDEALLDISYLHEKAQVIRYCLQQPRWEYATAAVTAMCYTIINVVAERAGLIVHIARLTPVFASLQLFAFSY